MKNLKTLLVAFITIASVTSLYGQSATKQVKRDKFKFGEVNDISHNKANDYTFSRTTGTYANLTGATSLNNNQIWDDPEYTVPIGFNFTLFDTTINTFNFGMGLGAMISTELDEYYQGDYAILVFETDLIDRGDISGTSQSPISYKVEGASGNRIFKLEWKNAGFYDEGDELGTLDDYVDVQLWLYEGTNDIEIHFGPIQVSDPDINYFGETGAMVGVGTVKDTNLYLLSGNPANPILENTIAYLNGTPSNGTIYRFSNTTSGIKSKHLSLANSKAYPNPFQDYTILSIDAPNIQNAELNITDIFGRTVKTISNIQTNQIKIERESLSNGVYFYHFTENGKALATGKLILSNN